jgi:hypothetical protein
MGYLIRYHGSSTGESLTEHLVNQDYEKWAHVQWTGEGWVPFVVFFFLKITDFVREVEGPPLIFKVEFSVRKPVP